MGQGLRIPSGSCVGSAGMERQRLAVCCSRSLGKESQSVSRFSRQCPRRTKLPPSSPGSHWLVPESKRGYSNIVGSPRIWQAKSGTLCIVPGRTGPREEPWYTLVLSTRRVTATMLQLPTPVSTRKLRSFQPAHLFILFSFSLGLDNWPFSSVPVA